jgi:serine/threonine-protein kinase
MSSFETKVSRDAQVAPGAKDPERTLVDGENPPFTRGPDHLDLGDLDLNDDEVDSAVRPSPPGPLAPATSPSNLVRTMLSSGKLPNLAAAALPPAALPPAASPERIQSVQPIAEGGMGVVEAAFDSVLLRRVARKTMHVSADDSPDVTARFIEEAQITAQLDHPNIVPVHDLAVNVEQGKVFFTMKLVDGETLSSVFRRLHANPFSGLELERVLRVFLKVCDAISFAHSRGVVHRDLKPDNIMVGSHGQVYVMDWGVALLQRVDVTPDSEPPISVARPSAEEIGTVVGTVQYMAPEQAFGLVADQGPLTDVYGLGAILYALLTGVGPSSASNPSEALRLARSGPIPAPETRPAWPTLPPGLSRIAMKALSVLPRDRQPSVDALRQQVEDFLRGGGWFQVQTFAAGATIMVEGDSADAAYLVTRGNCEVYRTIEGEKRTVRHVGAGEIFGEMGLLTRSPRTATVAALEDVTVMVITPEALEHELSHSGWLKVLIGALATRFRELDQSQAGAPGSR